MTFAVLPDTALASAASVVTVTAFPPPVVVVTLMPDCDAQPTSALAGGGVLHEPAPALTAEPAAPPEPAALFVPALPAPPLAAVPALPLAPGEPPLPAVPPALAPALASDVPAPDSELPPPSAPQHCAVLSLIAYELGLSESSVSEIGRRSLAKLGISSRADLARLYAPSSPENP